jgi:hypothetical protein
MAHLRDVVHEGADRLEEAAELRTLSKAGQTPLLGVPLHPNHVLSRILGAARDLVVLAVRRRFSASPERRYACSNACARASSIV